MNVNNAAINKAQTIKLVIFDVDGVLTDGKLFLGENDNEYKAFHVHDGLGIVLLLKNNIDVGIITARQSNIVANRMQSLGITHLYQGQDNKETALLDIQSKTGLANKNIAYLGDDLIDLPALKHCGLKMAVNNAHPAVKEFCDLVTNNSGGNGAAREACELILQAQDKLQSTIDAYLK